MDVLDDGDTVTNTTIEAVLDRRGKSNAVREDTRGCQS